MDIALIYNGIDRTYGLMKLESHLGTYQALSIPILYMFNPILAIIPLIGLLLSKTSTAIIGAVIGIILLKRIPQKLFKILVLALAAAAAIKLLF